ncbi:MAG TPA: hypothetical protein GXZ90_01690 [Clostridiales bacterium]|nr:hypothetical protein [Clostridiales bacterium]
MNIPVNSNNFNTISRESNSMDLENKLKKLSASDKELMDACKSFESYMVEQVFKEMKKTVKSEDDDNDYMQYFSDILYEEYASKATKNQDIGIAKMLFESMKRNNNIQPL